jgi:UDP-N-acetylmuramoyl-L-alanyl-D-glutamate--2,6-diaminopimelate ligase
MNFSDLLQGTGLEPVGNPESAGVDYDSRRVQPGWAFVAMRGESTDGNRYINAAIRNGAVAVITDDFNELPRDGVAWAVAPHGRKTLAEISANFYGRPADRLRIVGVTGTNGKTTTTFLIESILNYVGKKSVLVGTIEYHVAGRVLPAPHTTPESLELNQIFAEAIAAGATDVAMEVSSHALEQGRVWGIAYEVAVFSNLTRDHLDYHKDMDNYFASKRMLFEGTGAPPPQAAVINADDPYGVALLKTSLAANSRVITFGIKNGDFRARPID